MSHILPIFCIGLSYKNVSLDHLEQMTLSVAQQTLMLNKAASGQLPDVAELVILSTCNRVEFYLQCSSSEGCVTLFEQWSQVTGVARDTLRRLSVVLEGEAAVRHLFEVSAGLDLQVIGEPQILGQVADAYEQARGQKATSVLLSALMQNAIKVGKRVHAETAIGQGSLSISSVAAAHSKHILGDLANAVVLVIGTGEMARGAVTSLVRLSVDKLLIANHNMVHAEQMAAEFGGEVVPYTQLGEALRRADLVITAVTAPHPILHAADLKAVSPLRSGRPLIIFDIAMPRNVEPSVGALPDVQLFNLDDLQAVTDAHYAVRQAALPDAALIVTEELKAFQHWQSARAVVPTIQSLRGKAEAIRQSELDTLYHRLPNLDERSRALISEFSNRLVNKLLHQPTLKLKEKTNSDEGDLYASILQDLFALDEPNS